MSKLRGWVGVLLIALTGALSGCGAISEKENPSDTDFLVVSTFKASLLYSLFMGGVEGCKVTKHGVPHTNFGGEILWDGKTCKVRIEAGGREGQ